MVYFRKNIVVISMAPFLFFGCGDKQRPFVSKTFEKLESRSLLRYDSIGRQILDEFENIDGGDVEICLTGPPDRDENGSYFLMSKQHYSFLCGLVGSELKHVGYTPKSSSEEHKIKRLKVVIMDEEKQREVNNNYLLAR